MIRCSTDTVAGQFHALKMVLLHHSKTLEVDSVALVALPVVLPAETDDAKTALSKLKASVGSLKLAPTLITARNLWVKDLLLRMCQACWSNYGKLAKHVLNPQDAIVQTALETEGAWQDELVRMVVDVTKDRSTHTLLKLIEGEQGCPGTVEEVWGLLMELLYTRVKTGAILSTDPPLRYSGLAGTSIQASAAMQAMKAEFGYMLLTEAVFNLKPSACQVAAAMRWREKTAVRMLYLMAEQEDWELTPRVLKFANRLYQLLPDTKIVEDIHQLLRDLARNQKSSVSSRISRCLHARFVVRRIHRIYLITWIIAVFVQCLLLSIIHFSVSNLLSG